MLISPFKGGRRREGAWVKKMVAGNSSVNPRFWALSLYPEDCPEVLGQMQQQLKKSMLEREVTKVAD